MDRASLVRRAMVELVAEKGIHGASMGQVAARAGVATGTAYVHYASKDDLLVSAFVEVKGQIAQDVASRLDPSASPRELFDSVWEGIYEHLRRDPASARFLTQIDESPLRGAAHDALPDSDPLLALAAEMAPHLIDLPVEMLYELGLAPAVRIVSSGTRLDRAQLTRVTDACWKAISRD